MEIEKKPRGYWSLARCIEDAKNFKARSEWNKGSHSAYSAAQRNGWVDQCCEHMISRQRPKGYWSLERCIDDAKQFKTRTDWHDSSAGAYRKACRYYWLEQCCGHMISRQRPKGYWSLERCIDDANNYRVRTQWKTSSTSAYTIALRNGWIDQCCKHMVKRKAL